MRPKRRPSHGFFHDELKCRWETVGDRELQTNCVVPLVLPWPRLPFEPADLEVPLIIGIHSTVAVQQ